VDNFLGVSLHWVGLSYKFISLGNQTDYLLTLGDNMSAIPLKHGEENYAIEQALGVVIGLIREDLQAQAGDILRTATGIAYRTGTAEGLRQASSLVAQIGA